MTYQFEISNSVIYSANCHCHLKQCSWELNVISFECRATIWSLEINYTLNLDFSFSLSIFGWICSHTCKREKKRSYCFWISNEWALNHANPVQLLDLRVVWVHLYRNKFGLKCVRFRLCASLFCWMQEVFFLFSWWFYGDLVGDAADFNSWIIQMALISSAPCISFTHMSASQTC